MDFDDTLHDFAAAYTTALEWAVTPLCADGPGAVTPRQVRLACEQPWRAIWERYMARTIDDRGLWAERAAIALASAGTAQDPVRIKEFQDRYLVAMEEALRLFPDALPALDALAATQPRPVLGLLTNGPAATQRARLQRLGLSDRFDVIVISGDIGCSKPDPAFFAEALRRAGGLAPSEAVMIGDNTAADIVGAKAAGLAAVWLNRPGAPWPDHLPQQPDAMVGDLLAAVRWVTQTV